MAAEDQVIHDVLPDGSLGPPIDWTDPEGFADLCMARMSREQLAQFLACVQQVL